ncbi:MAG: hypothetical protein PHH93_02910 [Prolixibacteraceae bacterium]|nr:hypothetical protein [Prolixibacteraceae bacterium]
MITIPSVLLHDNVAVYPDDEDCNLFYCLKTTPEIRMVNNQPVFSGLFWTDKADGSSESVAGLAGGWINFDANLGVSPEVEDKIKQKIKSLGIQKARQHAIVKKERERLGLIAKARGNTQIPDPDVPKPGEVKFGAVNFTDGNVTLLEEKEGDLVAWSSAGGPASLLGDNNAAFALRLSAKGAAIWYKALKEGIKSISIRYDLKFRLRLPSLEIRAWAGSTQKKEIDRQVERVWKNVDKGCSDADVERIDVKEVTESLMEEGLMNIEIKKGSTEISDEHVSQLRNMAMKLIEDKVQEIIKSRIRGMTEEERKNSMIGLIKEEVNSFVELRFSQEDVVEWKIAPQGTIMNFLEHVPEEKRQQVTKLVDLSEHEVETIELKVNVDAPWEEEPFVNAVKVDMKYPSAEKEHSLLFKKDSPVETWRLRRPKNDNGIVKYNTSIYFKGISDPIVLTEQATNGNLNINVGKPGLVNINFKPHPNLASLGGKNKINAIQVDISYKDESSDDHFRDTVVFTAEEVEGKTYKKIIGKLIDAPLVYKVTYFAKSGQKIEMQEQKYYITENNTVNIYTPNPFEDTLDLNVELPLIPDDTVNKILAEFKYEDTVNEFESSDQVILSKEDNWESVLARLVLIDKNNSAFKYRYKIISRDDVAQSGWIDGEGDAETIILPILKIHINVSRLGLGTDYDNGLLSLHYEDGDTRENKEIFLTAQNSSEMLSWYIPRTGNNEAEYSYSLTLVDSEGKNVEISGTNKGKILFIQKP